MIRESRTQLLIEGDDPLVKLTVSVFHAGAVIGHLAHVSQRRGRLDRQDHKVKAHRHMISD
jgi:hypothetical protein